MCKLCLLKILLYFAPGVDSEEEDSGDSSDEDEDSRRSRLHQNGGLGHHRQINIPLHRQQPQPQKEQPPPLPPFEVSSPLSPPHRLHSYLKRYFSC